VPVKNFNYHNETIFLIAMNQDQKLYRVRVLRRCECRKGWTKPFWSPKIGPSAVFADFAAGGLAMSTFWRVFGSPRVEVIFERFLSGMKPKSELKRN
jgi:hypothetical protein